MIAIAAMDPYRVIGYKGRIPWHYSEDFRWFKRATLGNVLVMGRSTFESIGKPLPERFTYVVTNNPTLLDTTKQATQAYTNMSGLSHCYISGDYLKEMIQKWPGRTSYFWLCGGARIFKEFLPFCNEIYMSHIMDDYEGDCYFPSFEHMFPNQEILKENRDFWVVRHSR